MPRFEGPKLDEEVGLEENEVSTEKAVEEKHEQVVESSVDSAKAAAVAEIVERAKREFPNEFGNMCAGVPLVKFGDQGDGTTVYPPQAELHAQNETMKMKPVPPTTKIIVEGEVSLLSMINSLRRFPFLLRIK